MPLPNCLSVFEMKFSINTVKFNLFLNYAITYNKSSISGYPQRICAAHYRIPSRIRLSEECADLLRRIFVVDPGQRIPLRGIKQHPWFLHRDLPEHIQVAVITNKSKFDSKEQAETCFAEKRCFARSINFVHEETAPKTAKSLA